MEDFLCFFYKVALKKLKYVCLNTECQEGAKSCHPEEKNWVKKYIQYLHTCCSFQHFLSGNNSSSFPCRFCTSAEKYLVESNLKHSTDLPKQFSK